MLPKVARSQPSRHADVSLKVRCGSCQRMFPRNDVCGHCYPDVSESGPPKGSNRKFDYETAVPAAVKALADRGVRPSTTAVRLEMGGGDPKTIVRVLRDRLNIKPLRRGENTRRDYAGGNRGLGDPVSGCQRRAKLDYDTLVRKAVAEILAAGGKPGQVEVRNRMGQGSYGPIGRVLAAMRGAGEIGDRQMGPTAVRTRIDRKKASRDLVAVRNEQEVRVINGFLMLPEESRDWVFKYLKEVCV